MKREIIKALVFATATALATIGYAQDQQNQQRVQQGQTDQMQQGQQSQQNQQRQQPQDQPLSDYRPGASVILSGTVDSIGDEEFVLDYGEDKISVDLAAWEWSDQIDQRLSEGKQVTVSGTVDQGLFDRREIKADNIYVTNDFTYYYIVDENPAYGAQQSERETEQDGTFLSTRGEVTEVSDSAITVESQGNSIKVDLSELAYDPLDEEGVQQIQKGDRVYVFGDIGEDFFENQTMSAESLITLSAAREATGRQPRPAIERPGASDAGDVQQQNQRGTQ
jgi:uncharacterized protein YdeI (BOF family)